MMTPQSRERGSILLIFIISLPFLIMVVLAYSQLVLTSFRVGRLDQFRTAAQLAADAGADYGIQQLSSDNTWTGTSGDVVLQNDGKIKTTFTVGVSGTSDSKTLAVTGKTFFPVGSTTPSRSVSIYVDLYPVSAGSYSVVSGAGGLIMNNSSKVIGGDVFINGEINMSNTSQIGLSTAPVNVSVADDICPNPATSTYPRVCASGENGQPITISNTAHIYGTVKATNQTTGTGMSSPGLTSGTVAPQALPTYDRTSQKNAVTTNLTGTDASCNGSGTRTWAANTKITGNVTISNSCVVTVMGNVWITGNLSMNNTSQIKVADSLGSTRPVVMVDGSGGASFSNSAVLKKNSTGTGFEFITYYSTAGCSPDCTTVTGTDLANSRGITTINLSNTAAAPDTIFYAYWSQVLVANSGQLGAIVGQTIKLTNTGTITFGSSSVGTGQVVWIPQGYRRQ